MMGAAHLKIDINDSAEGFVGLNSANKADTIFKVLELKAAYFLMTLYIILVKKNQNQTNKIVSKGVHRLKGTKQN